MGAGKSTLGPQLAQQVGRFFIDLDEVIETCAKMSVDEIFRQEGEEGFRAREEDAAALLVVNTSDRMVVGLGGGAVTSEQTRATLREHATTIWLDVDVDTAWARVRETERPLAQDEAAFRRLYDARQPLYANLADARVTDLDDAVLAAAGVHVGVGSLELLGELVPGDGPIALVTEPTVSGIYGAAAQLALGSRLEELHELPTGEAAKQLREVESVWRALRVDRRGTLVALGGGSLTDAAGYAAAAYMRGIDWVAVPTTLVGQVDAAIGGKTAIDLPEAKNLVGAFHWPVRSVIDPALLATLPEAERRNGMAEVVKTGLLAGEPLWELDDAELVRRCAAFKAALCLRDPYDRDERRALNLGHTFAHALEAASDYSLVHGHAVALGLRATLMLSGRDTAPVDEVLSPEPAHVDRERAWQALLRDKKGALRLILLGDDGAFETDAPEADVRRALDTLIAS
jgi:3-dehydroquinate synthetase/gluconate kinase